MIVVGGVGIDVCIAMDLVESVKGMHKEIIKQKIVIIATETATKDVMNVDGTGTRFLTASFEWNTQPYYIDYLFYDI